MCVYHFEHKYVIKIIRGYVYIGKIYLKDIGILWITAIILTGATRSLRHWPCLYEKIKPAGRDCAWAVADTMP